MASPSPSRAPTNAVSGRLIFDEPRTAAQNMAVDDLLLQAAAKRGELALRFYGWSEPTLSLGYFQSVDGREAHHASRGCPLVRRASGGGAIVHDRPRCELTYAVAVPGVSRRSEVQWELYQMFHVTLIEVLAASGVTAVQCQLDQVPDPPPFLCFQRHTRGDVLIDGNKVLGSAQRRQLDAVLQHGSLLLAMSAAAPELPGVKEVSGRALLASEVTSAWLQNLSSRWPIEWTVRPLGPDEIAAADAIASDKFAASAWTHRR